MAREIKTTLAVDGEQAYKRAINEAKTSVRNLGTQLTLAQAEFKKTGDAQKLMETRAKALKSEIEAQDAIVKSLDGAMKDAVKQYGEGSKEAEKWEAELNRAKATMASLEAELTNNERGLDRNGKAFDDASTSASDFNDAVRGIGKGISFEMITTGIGKITSGFENAIKKAADLATEMWNMMRDAASWADDEITLAKIYGVDVEDLQRMQHAAKMVDTDIDTIVKARQKLMKAMGSELDSKTIQEAFQALRVPVYDNNGKMREMETVFWEAGRALMELDDEVLQNNVAMQLFGKSWMDLKPLFSAGSEAYKKAMEEATVVPQENIEKLGSFQDQLDRMDDEFKTLKMTVLSELAPAFEVLAKSLTDLMAEFNEYLQTDEGKAMMESLNEAIKSFFSEISNIDLASAVSAVGDGLGLVKEGFNWIKDNKDSIVDALKGIGIGFGVLKLAELAANLGKVTWGFKQLFNLGGGGNGGAPTVPPTNQTQIPTVIPTTRTQTPQTSQPSTSSNYRMNDSQLEQLGKNDVVTPKTQQVNETIPNTPVKTETNRRIGINAKDIGTTALFALPFALAIDGIISDQKMLEEMLERGKKVAAETETKKSEFSGSEAYDEWDALNAYIRMPDRKEGYEKIEGLADEYVKWFNDDLQNAVFDKMAESMTDEEFDAFHDAVMGIVNGDKTYSEEEIAARFDPLSRALEILEGLMAPGEALDAGVRTGLYAGVSAAQVGENLTSQDIAEFTKVPDAMKAAVAAGVSGIKVSLDGRAVGQMVAPYVSVLIAADILGV